MRKWHVHIGCTYGMFMWRANMNATHIAWAYNRIWLAQLASELATYGVRILRENMA